MEALSLKDFKISKFPTALDCMMHCFRFVFIYLHRQMRVCPVSISNVALQLSGRAYRLTPVGVLFMPVSVCRPKQSFSSASHEFIGHMWWYWQSLTWSRQRGHQKKDDTLITSWAGLKAHNPANGYNSRTAAN